jgi:ADP-ribose pyrophosphatase YjhB (NUDIX family)
MQTALATAPNSAIPAGLRKKAYDSSALSGITKHAAGVLHVAPDGDILLLRRAGKRGVDNFVGHWALPGGGVEEGETPEQGAVRENKEEIGQDVDPAGLKDLHKHVTPTGMAFHTFARPVDSKFSPTLNDEHSASGWFSLGDLPQPMHPAVESLIRDRIGAAAGMSEDDAANLGAGLAAWAKEPQAADEIMKIDVDDEDGQLEKLIAYIKANSEVGHSFGVVVDPEDSELARKFYIDGDGAFRIRDVTMVSDVPVGDSALQIAMDRDSIREKTRDGRLIVKRTHISKANVCPYRGKEIPGWEALGLDPNAVYNLLRDPDELRKAAPTLNGVQLLIKHIPVNANGADSHRPMETVGSVGSDAEFDGEYLDNSLYVNAKHGIEAIENNTQRELSAGYHYKPDMTPGNFRGTAFDGVMRDIVFNHVALVEDGRAGPDVVVGDEALKEQDMAKVTRFGAMTLSLTAASIAPLLAMDSRVTLPKDLFAPLTTKNFKDSRVKLLAGVRTAIDGKLRKGLALDASMEQFAKAIDAFSDDLVDGVDEPAPEDKQAAIEKIATVEPAKAITEPGSTYDAEPFKSFLREKGMGEDDIMKACDMMPKPLAASDSDETPEEKEAREKKEKEDKAANDAAIAAKDAEMKDMVTKPAMDQAIQAAVKQTRETERGIRAALAEVTPWVGEIPASMAFDSGADVYRHALVMRGVDGAKTLHADALLPILKTLPKAGARAPIAQDGSPQIAMDAVNKAVKLAPGLEHISTSL